MLQSPNTSEKNIGKAIPRPDLKLIKSCNCDKCVFENVWIQLQIDTQTFIIGDLYRHPNGNASHFTQDLELSLNKIDRNMSSVVAGDTNIDLNKYEEKSTFDYFTTFSSHMFLPYVLAPTRFTDYKVSTIDHIFAKLPLKNLDNDIYSGNLFADITDHLPNFIAIYRRHNQNYTNYRPFIRIFSDSNIENFKMSISNVDWENALNISDTHEAYNVFYNKIFKMYEACFPLKRLSRKRSRDKPWISNGIKKSINRRNNLYRKKIQNPTLENTRKFTNYRNILNSCIEQAEVTYYQEIFSDRQTGIKTFWKTFGQT